VQVSRISIDLGFSIFYNVGNKIYGWMDKFKELLMSKESMGYVYRLANESKKMLAATLRGDTAAMAEILEFAHNTESPDAVREK
jgi:hypothetical protein